MKRPTVSVLMPVYNAEKFINEAVESILNQTFSEFEFIIINDGSTDQSEAILKDFQKRDQRVKVISGPNKGYSTRLNEGLGYAKGDYIARMDADDIALPERFAKQVAFLEDHPNYVAVGSRTLLIDEEGLAIMPFSEQTSHEEIDAAHMTGRGGSISHPSVMLRRETLQSVGGYRENMEPAEDLDLFLRLAEIGKLANLPDLLLKYRLHPKSVGHSRRLEQQKAAMIAVIEAHRRRGLTPPSIPPSIPDENEDSVSELHYRWTWWALGAGNVETARKHAFLALRKKPVSPQSWKVLACALRGY